MGVGLKVGLVGVGAWGKNIARTICEDIPGLILRRATSKNPKAKTFVGPECDVHTDWREMLECTDLDAVFLAVPAKYNLEIASDVLARRLPVFIEKPVALNYFDARQILNIAIANDAIADVDHVDLFNPVFDAMLQEIHGPIKKIFGRIGGPYPRRADIKPLWEYSPHLIAAVLTLVGSMPVAVMARYLQLDSEPINDPRKEIVQMDLGFNNSCDVRIEAGNGVTQKIRNIDVYLEDEVLHFVDRAHVPLSRSPALNLALRAAIPVQSNTLPLAAALRSFEKKVRMAKPDISGLVMGVNVVSILEAVEKSLVTKDWCAINKYHDQ